MKFMRLESDHWVVTVDSDKWYRIALSRGFKLYRELGEVEIARFPEYAEAERYVEDMRAIRTVMEG